MLEEAQNPRVPLLERLRFLSISATNLDEFYNVRVAGLRELAKAGNTTPAADGLSPLEQLVLINENARRLLDQQHDTFQALRGEMEGENITILDHRSLAKADREMLASSSCTRSFRSCRRWPSIPRIPFPFIPNLGFSLALQMERKSDKRPLQALLPIPHQIDRFIALPAPEGGHRFLPLEELLLLHLDSLFPGYRYVGHCGFACCATAISRSRTRPRTWCANSRRR